MTEPERIKAWLQALKATMDARDPKLWAECVGYVDRVTSADKLLMLVRIAAECNDVGIIRLAAELAAPDAGKVRV